MLTTIALAVLFPGWDTHRRIRQLAIALFVAGVLAPLMLAAYAVFSGRQWVALTLDAGFLAWVITVGVVALVVCPVQGGQGVSHLREGPERRQDARHRPARKGRLSSELAACISSTSSAQPASMRITNRFSDISNNGNFS